MSEIYHILNRSIDERKIFSDKQDCFRFVHDLFEFNNEDLVNSTFYAFQRNKDNVLQGREFTTRGKERKQRKLLVNIHAFSIMPNHYHLMLSPRIDNGIERFMQKLGAGYVRYYNQKHKRKGTIFEGGYKSVLVKKEPHFYHLPYYIHLNPLDIEFPEWREGRLKNYTKALEFLNNYRWSSHLDYTGKKNFPSVTDRNFLLEIFGGVQKYAESVQKWLKDLELDKIRDFMLE